MSGESLQLQVETDVPAVSTSSSTRKKIFFGVAAVLLVAGVVAFVAGAPFSSPSAVVVPSSKQVDYNRRSSRRRKSTTDACPSTGQTSMVIKGKRYDLLMTTSGGFQQEYSSTTTKWTLKAIGGAGSGSASSQTKIYGVMAANTGNMLKASGTLVQVKAGNAPTDSSLQWQLWPGSCDKAGTNTFYLKNMKTQTYLRDGIFFPDMTTSKGTATEFYIFNHDNGKKPCGIQLAYCKEQKYCRTGMLVSWHASNATQSIKTATENKALLSCNTHCKACPSWDSTCKKCGGTIDRGKDYTAKTNAGVKKYYKQCNCDSAFKVAGMSVMAFLFVMFNVKYNSA